MKNVLMLSQYFPPDVNGSSTRSYNVARSLLSQGCKVTVISTFPHFPERKFSKKYSHKISFIEESDGIKIIRMWIPKLPHSPYYKRVLLHISFCFAVLFGLSRVGKFDVIVAMNPTFFVGFPAWICKVFFQKKLIRNVDDLWPEVFYDLGIVKSKFLKRVLDFFSNISYKVSDAIIPVSQGYVSTLTEKYHIPKEKIFVIEHGVDIKKFGSLAKKHLNQNEKKTIMYSGAINIGYDFEPVIKAAKLLESFSVRFVIRGTGENVDDVRKMIKRFEVKNVEVQTDLLEKNEFIDYLNTADVFLLPMNFGVIDYGLPTKILEYQVLGKPIVCISSGEAGRYIERTKSGLVLKEKDSKKLAEMIKKLIIDENLAKQLGTNGFEYINKNLTLEKVGERLLKVINSCS